MRDAPIGSYRDADGTSHELVVRQSRAGEWRVLDVDVETETTHVVDTLGGDQDGRPQAEAVARDYLITVGGDLAGTGPAAGEPIPEQGGTDGRSHRRPQPAPRVTRARGAALPRPAR